MSFYIHIIYLLLLFFLSRWSNPNNGRHNMPSSIFDCLNYSSKFYSSGWNWHCQSFFVCLNILHWKNCASFITIGEFMLFLTAWSHLEYGIYNLSMMWDWRKRFGGKMGKWKVGKESLNTTKTGTEIIYHHRTFQTLDLWVRSQGA